MRPTYALLFTTAALLAGESAAQTTPQTATPSRVFCCDDAGGRKVCGDFLPPQCQNRAYEERDNRGFVLKKIEAPLTPEQQAKRAAENARKEEEAKKAVEERRRTLALLSTYANEQDIDSARDRALADISKTMQQAKQRLEEALKKQKKLEIEKEFYKGKALPEPVKAQVRDNDTEIKAQQAAVDGKIKEMNDVRSKFTDEKKRYLELTGKKHSDGTPMIELKPHDKPIVVPSTAPVVAPTTTPAASVAPPATSAASANTTDKK